MAYVYMIYNSENNKVYIGQTVHTPDKRFKQHCYLSVYGTTKLYDAMRSIGTDKFNIATLAECTDTELTMLEAEYINKYNSIVDGYNSVIPTSKVKRYNTLDLYGDELLDDYLSGMSYNDIGEKYSLSRNSISKLCSAMSEFKHTTMKHSDTPIPVVMYTIDFEPVGKFSSIKNAGMWLRNNTQYSIDRRNLYNYIHAACKKGNVAYGHRWQYLTDLKMDGMTFRSKFDIINYLDGREYTVVNGVIYCGDIKKHIKVGGYRKTTVNIPEKSQRVNKLDALRNNKELAFKLYYSMNYSQIAREYGCSPNAVKKMYIKLFSENTESYPSR